MGGGGSRAEEGSHRAPVHGRGVALQRTGAAGGEVIDDVGPRLGDLGERIGDRCGIVGSYKTGGGVPPGRLTQTARVARDDGPLGEEEAEKRLRAWWESQ